MRSKVKIFYEPLSRAALLFIVFGAIGVTIAAMPLAEYRERLREAAGALNSLAVIDEDDGEKDRAAEQTQTFAEVRRSLPPNERIEWRGETVTADNTWLHAALDRLEQLPITHPTRTDELTRLVERLNALSDRGAEVETLSAAAARDKEAEKGRLAAILQRPEYRQQDEAGGALRRLLDQFLKWLRDLFPEPQPLRPGTSRGLSTVAQIVVYALALAVIGFVVWKFRSRLFRRDVLRRVVPKREARVVLGERVGAEQTATDLLNEAEQLARAGDLRGAIRKGYIALLCELGDRKIIRLAQHKTNRDYLDAVRASGANQNLYSTMKPLTATFERHWYGLEPATEADWEQFKSVVSGRWSVVSS
ncbi:MAG: DUF4129 domain-containing protein [Acidobacteriota bacterium]|nr:DUF4129 domain-containing protein [Acidobacteriota bacterium]